MFCEWKDNEISWSREALAVNLIKCNKNIKATVNTAMKDKNKIKIPSDIYFNITPVLHHYNTVHNVTWCYFVVGLRTATQGSIIHTVPHTSRS